jgi:hypothetical protein
MRRPPVGTASCRIASGERSGPDRHPTAGLEPHPDLARTLRRRQGHHRGRWCEASSGGLPPRRGRGSAAPTPEARSIPLAVSAPRGWAAHHVQRKRRWRPAMRIRVPRAPTPAAEDAGSSATSEAATAIFAFQRLEALPRAPGVRSSDDGAGLWSPQEEPEASDQPAGLMRTLSRSASPCLLRPSPTTRCDSPSHARCDSAHPTAGLQRAGRRRS